MNSQSMLCGFFFFIFKVSLKNKSFFILMNFCVPIFSLIYHTFCIVCNKSPSFLRRLYIISPIFLSRSFIALVFTFRSMIHFEFFFVYWVRVFCLFYLFLSTCIVICFCTRCWTTNTAKTKQREREGGETVFIYKTDWTVIYKHD